MQNQTGRRFVAVLTTIQQPTPAVRALGEFLVARDGHLVVVGDAKGPEAFNLPASTFLSLTEQLDLPFRLARALPRGHYARKNVGYLHAIAAGAECLYETDDDNAPLPRWAPRQERTEAVPVEAVGEWVNVYRAFSAERIWPRGFPLDLIVASHEAPPALVGPVQRVRAPIQQGLANGSPDVDAVWRLVLDRPFVFDDERSVVLPAGAWCPFNSQSTWWWPVAYPLLYLPSHCSFRMTDIWRSFVAQRCLWELGCGLVFHAPEVVQERNEHDLMRDFSDEIPGYTRNRELVRTLEGLSLDRGEDAVPANLLRCYAALVDAGFFPATELNLVRTWLGDLERIEATSGQRGLATARETGAA